MAIDLSSAGFWIFILVINAVTFFLYYYDKNQAGISGYRVSERTLMILAALGGSPAAFIAQRMYRHKTRKATFQLMFWLIVLVQIIYIFVKLLGLDLVK
jgi:uncharacterized membrane protein YsdA (DUF1294 family)